jgi:hypothetical protein
MLDKNLGMDRPLEVAVVVVVVAVAVAVAVVAVAVDAFVAALAGGRHDGLGLLAGELNSCHGSGSRENSSRKLSALCTPRSLPTVMAAYCCSTGDCPGGSVGGSTGVFPICFRMVIGCCLDLAFGDGPRPPLRRGVLSLAPDATDVTPSSI